MVKLDGQWVTQYALRLTATNGQTSLACESALGYDTESAYDDWRHDFDGTVEVVTRQVFEGEWHPHTTKDQT